MTTTTQPFLAAEIAYRRDRAIAEYHQPAIRRPRHWVPRRPSLSLPTSGRRPVSLTHGG